MTSPRENVHALAQIHKEPTREENILNLLITNKPGLIKSSHSVPGISDHCAVVTELDIDPPYRRTKPRPVRQFKKANCPLIVLSYAVVNRPKLW